MCVCVSSEPFVKIAHVLVLQIDGCWCGPHWPALTCAAGFRAANLLAYLAMPGGLALTCTASVLHRFPVAQMVEHGTSNAKIMGSIPRESKKLIKCKTVTSIAM